jgi:hypothetical protein
MRLLCMICFLSCFVNSGYLCAQNPENIFKNGSFNGTKGEDKHGEFWSAGSTPDLNDEHGNVNTSTGYTWTRQPKASKDGGTWQNLYSEREYLEQEVKLEPGEFYTISFEYTAMGIKATGMEFSSPVGIYIYINGDIVFKTPRDRTLCSWENATYQFKATTSRVTVRFSASDDQYVGIDGVSLVKTNGKPRQTPAESCSN